MTSFLPTVTVNKAAILCMQDWYKSLLYEREQQAAQALEPVPWRKQICVLMQWVIDKEWIRFESSDTLSQPIWYLPIQVIKLISKQIFKDYHLYNALLVLNAIGCCSSYRENRVLVLYTPGLFISTTFESCICMTQFLYPSADDQQNCVAVLGCDSRRN